jgi:serine O-acetyltransferase
MADIELNGIERLLRGFVQHYNPQKYWRLRQRAVSCQGRLGRFLGACGLFYVKRCDAFNNASTGAHLGYGASFLEAPHLPHGLYGIVISHNAAIGRDCTIFHQVTIGEGKGGAPVIGDHVLIGAGAKILGKVTVGDGAKIGANCVVTEDVPPGATVVMPKARCLIREEG